jgi:hypothetical protein
MGQAEGAHQQGCLPSGRIVAELFFGDIGGTVAEEYEEEDETAPVSAQRVVHQPGGV